MKTTEIILNSDKIQGNRNLVRIQNNFNGSSLIGGRFCVFGNHRSYLQLLFRCHLRQCFTQQNLFKTILAQHFVVANYCSVLTVFKKVTATKFSIKSHEHAMIHGEHFNALVSKVILCNVIFAVAR